MSGEVILDEVPISACRFGPNQRVDASCLLGNQPRHDHCIRWLHAINILLGVQFVIEIRRREAGERRVRGRTAVRLPVGKQIYFVLNTIGNCTRGLLPFEDLENLLERNVFVLSEVVNLCGLCRRVSKKRGWRIQVDAVVAACLPEGSSPTLAASILCRL
jgi:hypothetical protein